MVAVNVPKLMNGLMADLQSEAWTHGIKLVSDISTEMVVDCDATALHAGLTQLISTLVRVGRAGSSISLITVCDDGKDGGSEVLSVRVEAPGVTSPLLDASVTQLAHDLAKTPVMLEVDSTERAWSLALTLPNARRLPESQRPKIAVVVDDDTDTQDFLRAVLESHGMRVISVSDGFDALLVVERHRPQVVLTDILMPNMNGIDLVSRLKQAFPDLPVIVFSGYRDALIKSIAGLPDRILPKPMTRDQVISALQDVLQDR